MAQPRQLGCTREKLLALQAELGSDRCVAARLGVTEHAVRYWRKRCGLPPHRPARIPLQDKMLALSLARQGATAAEAAKRMGRTASAVYYVLALARRMRGCARVRFASTAPALHPAPPKRSREDVLAALGAAQSDLDVARAWRVSRARVQQVRKRFGIPALVYERLRRRKREAKRMRAQQARDLLARQLLTVHQHRVTVAQAARRFRLPRAAVQRLLRHARMSRMAPHLRSQFHEVTDPVILALFDANPGASDMQAARLAGLSLLAMQRHRRRLGIATALTRRKAAGLPLMPRRATSGSTGNKFACPARGADSPGTPQPKGPIGQGGGSS